MEGGRAILKVLSDNKPAPLPGNLGCQESLLEGSGGLECLFVEQRAHKAVCMRVLEKAPVYKLLQVTAFALLCPNRRKAGAFDQHSGQKT